MRLTLNYKTKQFYIHFCVCSLCVALTRSYFISRIRSLLLPQYIRICALCLYIRRACVFIRFFSSVNFSVFVHNLFPYGRNLSFVCLHHFYSYDFSVRFQCVWFVSFFFSKKVFGLVSRLQVNAVMTTALQPSIIFVFFRSELMLPIFNSTKASGSMSQNNSPYFAAYCCVWLVVILLILFVNLFVSHTDTL